MIYLRSCRTEKQKSTTVRLWGGFVTHLGPFVQEKLSVSHFEIISVITTTNGSGGFSRALLGNGCQLSADVRKKRNAAVIKRGIES